MKKYISVWQLIILFVVIIFTLSYKFFNTLISIENIKDISSIGFSFIGSIVAILTYLAAKQTILQPVRTEVIKKQTDLLIEILNFIDSGDSLDDKIDYFEIIHVNVLNSMILCGCVFNEQEKVIELIKTKGSIQILFMDENGQVSDYELVTMFEEEGKIKAVNDKKRFYDDAKKGIFKVNSLKITNVNNDFRQKLSSLKNNPFIPENVKVHLNDLEKEIINNLQTHLRTSVEESINEAFQLTKTTLPNISGVYNIFNHKKIDHRDLVEVIRLEVRKYLKIDSMP